MESYYRPEHWHEAFVMVGGASAALAGLLIVAVSVRADQIADHLWMRARNTTISMVTLTVGSLILLTPQPSTLSGLEVILFNLLCAASLPGPVVLYYLRRRKDASIWVPTLAFSLYLLAAAGGLSIMLGRGGGIIWIAIAYGAYLLFAPYNAFLLLIPRKEISPTQ